ncbi:unnamed protein product, partial [Iphiclides podalirius]
MKLITIFALCVMLDVGNAQFDFGQFFNQQQQLNIAYPRMSQASFYGQQVPFPLNNYNYRLEECECSCDTCYAPRPCCVDFCAKCAQANSPSGYFYYPYPYIVVPTQVTSKATSRTTTTEMSTTTAATTTTTPTTKVPTTEATTTTISETTAPAPQPIMESVDAETFRPDHFLHDKFLKELVYSPTSLKRDNDKIVMTAMRRTKPRWMPKYGIVPIPDQIAEKLMLRIRQMKVLHPEMDTIRRTEPMNP